MSHLGVFLNTRVERSGPLAWVGDKGLAPFRYLFNGKTVRIQKNPMRRDGLVGIHHVDSFHEKGSINTSRTWSILRSSSTGMIKTALAVVLLVPGLLLAVFKALAYLSSDVRKDHQWVVEHFTPIDRTIGSPEEPIESYCDLSKSLIIDRASNPKNQKTRALIIHGDGNLTINEDPGILRLNPMKLVLVGARIVHEPSHFGCLDEKMLATGKWQLKANGSTESGGDTSQSFATSHKVETINEALQASAPRRDRLSCKRYHMIFELAKPQTV